MSGTKITIEVEWEDRGTRSVTVTDPSPDLPIDEMGQLIKQALMGMGFHPESVIDLFGDEPS